MKKILLLLTVALLPISLFAQEQRKYEIGAEASFGFSAQNGFNAKNKSNHYSFDVFGGYKFNEHFLHCNREPVTDRNVSQMLP